MRSFYLSNDRIVCVDAPEPEHKKILQREKVENAKVTPKDEALLLARKSKKNVEWFDLGGRF